MLHEPVMLEEVKTLLRPALGGVVVDGTFGAGGYTNALLNTDPHTRILAIDRDPDAFARARMLEQEKPDHVTAIFGRFGDLASLVEAKGLMGAVHGVVLDIGVSSMQLDEAERGFSFLRDGPLDMRMEQDGVNAADLVNGETQERLADILFHYGEERQARAIARAIVAHRQDRPFTTTGQLADLISSVVKTKPNTIHPATRSFQALRIAVNDELVQLVQALEGAEAVLKPGGILVVVSFHSLEDRIVKRFFSERSGRMPQVSRHLPQGAAHIPGFSLLTRSAIEAGYDEITRNPRARSAKLRAARRIPTPAQPCPAGVKALAVLPQRKRERR
jgi:16S rRNA (cytosine1402-N4)-methyltransferase